MATTAKDSTTPRRERKSSMTPASLTKRPTKPTTPDKPSSTSNSSSTEKSCPSYLRSTASSSHPTRQSPSLTRSGSLKKQQGSNEESKSPRLTPTLNRRRSFDKPPSPSGLRRSNMSPGREVKEPPQRSRSLSAKSISNAPKPTSKSVAGIKPQGSYEKSIGIGLRRTSSVITSGSSKKEVSRSSRNTTGGTRVPRSRDITQILNLEADFEALDHHDVGEVDKIESIEGNSEDLPDPKLAEEDPDDQHQDHASDTGPVNDAAEESESNVDGRDEEVIQAEVDLDDQVEEVNNISKDHESNDIDQGSGLTSEETKAEEVIEEKEEDENKVEVDMEVVDGPKQEQESAVKEEAKPEEPVPRKKPQVAAVISNKKEAAPAYNDVIEETASKLISQDQKRRNKVKALVGAFETVIDYESGSKQN